MIHNKSEIKGCLLFLKIFGLCFTGFGFTDNNTDLGTWSMIHNKSEIKGCLLFPQHLLCSRHYVVWLGGGSSLSSSSIGHGGIHSTDSDYRGIKVVERRAFSNTCTDLSPYTILWPATLHSDTVVRLLDALIDSVHVQGPD